MRGFAGLGVMFPDGWAVAGDYQTGSGKVGDDKALSSVGICKQITPMLSAEVGYTNAGFNYAGLTGAPDHNLFAGVTLNWGGAK